MAVHNGAGKLGESWLCQRACSSSSPDGEVIQMVMVAGVGRFIVDLVEVLDMWPNFGIQFTV
jgi:hypothetical protein